MNGKMRIFLFHGVVREHRHMVRNYTRKHLSIDQFVTFMRETLQLHQPVTMDECLKACLGDSDLPPSPFAVTFDDGFENNASIVAPILADLGVPATFYVSTGFIGTDLRSWTDEIESALEDETAVDIRGVGQGVDGHYESAKEKQALMEEIRQKVKTDPAIDPYEYASNLVKAIGPRQIEFCGELDAKMTWDQVRDLDKEPLFTVGGHGHTHRILSHLGHDELVDEIRTSLRLLERAVGHPVIHYSYPEGMPNCYSPEVVRVLRQFGVRCCPTAIEGFNEFRSDPFELKRILVDGSKV
jgi:peptidoglycan/xylan/chitin deacetylase (PgdA/CDA1 family)